MTLDLPRLLGLALFGWSLVVETISLVAVRRFSIRARREKAERAEASALVRREKPSVLVVRPCAGHEPALEKTLFSLAQAARSFDVRVRFAIEGPEDAALASAERAREVLWQRGIEAEIVFTGAGGPNRKAAQLSRAASDADVILVADSDVDLADTHLDTLVAPLLGRDPVWVAWAPPAEHAPPRTLGDRASAAVLGASLHAFPLLAQLDPRCLVGKLFAIRASALVAIGGFGSLVDYLGEDIEIARRVREKGGSAVAAPLVARSLAEGRSWDAAVARFSRWLTVIRAQRPLLLLSYPLLFFPTVPILVFSALVAFVAPHLALVSALLVLVSRLGVALFVARVVGRRVRPFFALSEALLADLLLALAFLRALCSRTVTWRDRVLVVDRAGLLRQPSAVKS